MSTRLESVSVITVIMILITDLGASIHVTCNGKYLTHNCDRYMQGAFADSVLCMLVTNVFVALVEQLAECVRSRSRVDLDRQNAFIQSFHISMYM